MTMTMQDVANLFKPVQDFPKDGIKFWNVSDLTQHAAAYNLVTDELYARCIAWETQTGKKIDYIAGFDARGFIFGGVVAKMLKVGFLQIRKKGKLPEPTISETYELEYGTATLQVNVIDLAGKVVVLVDDLLATGGTAEAGFKLIKRLGGEVAMFLTVTELPLLGGRVKLQQYPVESLLTEIDGQLKANVRYCVDAIITDTDTGEIVLIERLPQADPNNPTGLAMVGGGIELGESAVAALVREIDEEAHCVVEEAYVAFYTLLTGADRDPRGDQVSLVFKVKVDANGAYGEADKTEVHTKSVVDVAIVTGQFCDVFAFPDHAATLHEYTLQEIHG